jgi:hypothetical protein
MRKPLIVQAFAEDLTMREMECFKRAVEAVNGLQSEFRVQDRIRGIHLPGKRGTIREDASFDVLYERMERDRAFCLTSRRFSRNEFQSADERCSFLSIEDWEEEYAPPSLQTYIVYQFAFAFLMWAADHVSDKVLTHKKTIGCRMDYCGNKSDLKLGMLAGYICPSCRGHLSQLGATPKQVDAIDRILAHVQAAAKGYEDMPDEWHTAFVVMRFKEDGNRAAFEQGIKPGLRDVGITAQRADDIIESRPLLEKITQQILRARFVIAKVDVNRMNIYYELGLAMGRQKNVLLVSEQSLVKLLPSDLSNWECLTYPRGDYRILRRKVAKYYQDNYHLGKF